MNPPVRRSRKAAIEVSWVTPETSAGEIASTGEVTGNLVLRSTSAETSSLTLGELTDLVAGLGYPAAVNFSNDSMNGPLLTISLRRPATSEEQAAAAAHLESQAAYLRNRQQQDLEILYQADPAAFLAFAARQDQAASA